MSPSYQKHLQEILSEITAAGLSKKERVIATPQGADIAVSGGAHVLNFCANNYLGLADHPEVVRAAHAALGLRAGLRAVHLRHAGDPQGT
jgi:glycine C-acetyltransferase